jgi:hypothetical protein
MANVMAAASMIIIMVLYSLPQQRMTLDFVSPRMRKDCLINSEALLALPFMCGS